MYFHSSVRTARTLGVSCLGPWNLSRLNNLRMDVGRLELKWDDVSLPVNENLVVEYCSR